MACAIYDRLVVKWKLLIYQMNSGEAAVSACWRAVEHRLSCEVCRDEDFAHGCFGIYRVLMPDRMKAPS